MTITLLQGVNKNVNDWLALRKRTIGSSEIAGVCGLNPHRSPLKIWMEKTGKIEPEDDNDFMFLGRAYEATVAKMFKRKHPEMPSDPEPSNCLYGHDDVYWATCTPDYTIEVESETRIVECKTSTIRSLKFWDDGVAPDDKRVQVVWQLGILNLDTGYLAALIGGFEYREVLVEASSTLFEQLMEIGQKFMDFVKSDIPPTAGPHDKELIRAIYAEQQESLIELPGDSLPLLQEWERLQKLKTERNEDLKYLNENLDKIQNNLRLMLGNSTHGKLGPWEIRIKKSNRSGYSVAPTVTERFTVKNLAEAE